MSFLTVQIVLREKPKQAAQNTCFEHALPLNGKICLLKIGAGQLHFTGLSFE